MRSLLHGIAALLVSACATAPQAAPAVPAPLPAIPGRPAAPWSATALAARDVPAAFVTAWRAAPNRASCALIAPETLATGAGAGGTARVATFSGGWGVAFDMGVRRSAFGVAGTGALVSSDEYDKWPHRMSWADGSTAGYGPEGGQGLTQLAYIHIAGQQCLYNVWSQLGLAHLEHLIGELRFVRTR